MKDRNPIASLERLSKTRSIPDLKTYDYFNHDEEFEGYCEGTNHADQPGDNHSDAYWFGWLCGTVDAGFMPCPAKLADFWAARRARGSHVYRYEGQWKPVVKGVAGPAFKEFNEAQQYMLAREYSTQ